MQALTLTLLLFSILFTFVNEIQAANSNHVIQMWNGQSADYKVDKYNVQLRQNSGADLPFCGEDFLSITLDSSIVYHKWRGFNFSSPKLQNLASGLSPVSLRFGGTAADFVTFQPDGSSDVDTDTKQNTDLADFDMTDRAFVDLMARKQIKKIIMTGKDWESFTSFVSRVGWKLVFDFNLFKWKKSSHDLWNPSNAKTLLNFSQSKGINISAFQLGNEPNSFRHNFNLTVTPKSLVADLRVLKSTLKEFSHFDKGGIFGPEATSLSRHRPAYKYMTEFLQAGGSEVVDAASWHHYYIDGRTATVDQFLNPQVLDGFRLDLKDATELTRQFPPVVPLKLTETSSCYGGGAPGLSDGFAAGFMWLDKLGLCAQYNVTAVFRQSFYKGHYALISPTLEPNPDYYLSVLFKRLIHGPVLTAEVQPWNPRLRIYANCAKTSFYQYPQGAVVFYFLNLGTRDLTVDLTKYGGYSLDLFLLTPGDEDGLTSKFVKLNGEVLEMQGENVPALKPKTHTGPVVVEPQSFGFIVVPTSNDRSCFKD